MVAGSVTSAMATWVMSKMVLKYWQAQSSFDVRWDLLPQTLAIGWGINFKYPGGFPFDGIPETLQDLAIHASSTGHNHAINSWLTTVLKPVSDVRTYIKGTKVITSAVEYEFPKHDEGVHSYLWTSLGDTPQLNLFSDPTISSNDHYFWEFYPNNQLGNTHIDSANGGPALDNVDYIIEWADNPYGTDLFYIRRSSDMNYAYFNTK